MLCFAHFGMLRMFVALAIGHFLGDFALQSDFTAQMKNPWRTANGIPWFWPMLAHCAMHAGIVWAITGSMAMCFTELLVHLLVDFVKCDLSTQDPNHSAFWFHVDQIVHLGSKLAWAFALCMIGGA